MFDFPTFIQVPLAEWVDAIVKWLLTNWSPFFDFIGGSILYILGYIETFLLWLPWWALLLLVGLAAWRTTRLWWVGLLMATFLVLIGAFNYWELTMMTLALVITSVVISLLLGISTGILMARVNIVEAICRPVINFMHKTPSFIFLIIALMFFGLGKAPAVFATVIYAAPPIIRLTNAGIRQAPEGLIETAQAFGSNRTQILLDIQWPLAIPSIVAGINQTTMMALGLVIIASLIGAGGLGQEVLAAIEGVDVGRGFVAGLSILLLVIVMDRITCVLTARQQHDF